MRSQKLVHVDSLLMKALKEIGLLFLIYLTSYYIGTFSPFISCLIFLITGIVYYIYYVLVNERSFLNFKAVFSGVWLCTIGLAQLRLLEYQVTWEFLTWVNLCFAHLSFLFANDLAHNKFSFFESRYNLNKINTKNMKIQYEMKKERFFWIATFITLMGIVSFIINVIIKGYIPLFLSASNASAYVEFYTRLHIFVVASMVGGGFSYYCIRKCQLSLFKNILLGSYILILVFIIPILLVQRGTFINAALILTAVIYLLSNRKFWVLLTCIITMLLVYQLGSSLRGYSDDQLNEIFTPKEVTIGNNDEMGKSNGDIHSAKYKIPPKVAFFYSYLTVSQDNFNSIVATKKDNSWGIFQLKPFNVILRSEWIEKKLDNTKVQKVLPHLNSANLISYAYNDFGLMGVIIFTSLWSFSFGLVESFYTKYKGVFSSLAYGVCLIPVALCFFDPWMSNFTTWLLWGTVFVMFLASSFTLKKERK